MTLLAAALAASLVAVASLVLGAPEALAAPGDFVTTWKTTSDGEAITIPGTGTYTINWGDRTTNSTVTGPQTHTYTTAGTYTVSITGGLERISLGPDHQNAEKLQTIEQWGDMEWSSMKDAFKSTSAMTYVATDAPDLSKVNDMSGMFNSATTFNGDLSSWNVSQVTDMSLTFRNAAAFNGNLSSWDVSQVTNMESMFFRAAAFDGDLSSWDVSQVTNMNSMFNSATSFNGDLSSWDVSKVTDMNTMFDLASSFDQNLGRWYVTINSTSIDRSDIPGIVGRLSAQNTVLDDHEPEYAIGQGSDSDMFEIIVSSSSSISLLNMTSAVSDRDKYTVNITASNGVFLEEGAVFENGNNWRVLEITVTDGPPADNSPPTVSAGSDQTRAEGSTVNLDGTVTDTDTEDTLIYEWTHDGPSGITFANPAVLSTTFTAPNVAANTTFTVTLTVNDGTVDVSDTLQVTITDSPNSPPVIDAGADQEVVEGATVTLSGTASDVDPEDALEYSWTHDGALAITFANPAALSTTFTAPDVAADTAVTVTLTVNDGTVGVSDALQVNITDSPNTPPTVEAGPDQEVAEGATVTLSGTATDADPEDILTYSWTHDGALAITFANPAALSTTFTAPDVAADTAVTVTLTVNDGTVGVSDALQVNITDSPNSPPVVGAGADQEVVEGAAVSLSGTATDADPEDILTYSWTHDGALAITFANPAALSTTFTAPDVAADTAVTVTLTVNDGTVGVSDALQVNITDSPNSPPVVGAGADQEVVEGAAVSLSGTATDADPEDILTYSWTHDGALAITFANPAALSTTFTAPDVAADTAITVTLTVNDGTVDVSDALQVTITDSPNSPPVVGAGADQEVVEGAAVSLSGTATDADPEDTLIYEWTHDGPSGITFANPAVLSTTFTAPNVAANTTFTVTLTVNDGTVDVSDTLQVTITDSPNSPPTVNAGQNQEVVEGAAVSLSGTATDDDPEDTLMYSWTHNSTLSITLGDDTAPDTSFTAPNVSEDTPVKFTLTVNDGTALFSDTVIITVTDETIRGASSGKRPSAPPPAIDLNALASRGVVIPPHIAKMALGHGSDPIAPVTPDGTFDFLLVINGRGYLLAGSTNTLVPHTVAAGQPVTIKVVMHDDAQIAYFAIYLNLKDDQISHLQSDAQVIWDSGQIRVIDPNGLMHDVAVTLSGDPDDPAKKTATLTVTFSEGMGETNMVIRAWNAAGQITEVKIFDVLDVRAPEPEPATVDPEPEAPLATVDPGPTEDQDSAERGILAIRMWSGFEPESISDAQLLDVLGLDYPGISIPDWVMTELGPLVVKEWITLDEFKTALEYVLERA